MSRYIDAERIDFRLIRPTYITTGEECMLLNIRNLIDRQPTADVVPVVHGEWRIAEDMPKLDNTFSIECSICGQLMLAHHNENYPNFCCNCGADMRGGTDER